MGGLLMYNEAEILKKCAELGLNTLYDDFELYEAQLQKSEAELNQILNLNLDKHAESITFEQVCSITFIKAKDIIFKMSVKKRIDVLKVLDYNLDHLYKMAADYGEPDVEVPITPKVYLALMGRIKHLEILMQWLYGIE
jgi:hypothetical protein